MNLHYDIGAIMYIDLLMLLISFGGKKIIISHWFAYVRICIYLVHLIYLYGFLFIRMVHTGLKQEREKKKAKQKKKKKGSLFLLEIVCGKKK